MSNPIAVYSQNGGISVIQQAVPFAQAPTSTDVNYNIGTLGIVESANALFVLTSKTTSNGIVSAHWSLVSGGTGIQVINGDSGSVTGNTITLTGGSSGAVFTGSGTTMTESFDFLELPSTNASGDGVIYLNGENVLQAYDSTAANSNLFVGIESGNFTNTSINNCGVGSNTLNAVTSGSSNFAGGYNALSTLNSGSNNTSAGAFSGTSLEGSNNTTLGYQSASFITGSINHNTLVGASTGVSYRNGEASNILIGSQVIGTIGESNTCRVGSGTGTGDGQLNRVFFSGISGVSLTNPSIVTIDTSTNQLGAASAGGTFTPGVAGNTSAGTASYFTQTGQFVRFGNFVFFIAFIVWSSATGTGQLLITGLPVTVGNTDVAIIPITYATPANGANLLTFGSPNRNNTDIFIYTMDQTTAVTNPVTIPASGSYALQGFYTTV